MSNNTIDERFMMAAFVLKKAGVSMAESIARMLYCCVPGNGSAETVNAYGVEWDYSKSGTKLTRIDAAASLADPIPAISLTDTGTSSFDNIVPWSGMKSEKIGTDEMVYIPEFYFCVEDDQSNSKMRWWISAEPKDGFTLHPGSGRYISRYHVSNNGGYVSQSGLTPISTGTQSLYRANCSAKGENWWMLDIATWSAIQILYLVEYADFDIQTVLGSGQVSGSIKVSGATDSAMYHTIKRNSASNQYRWIENLYSNTRDAIDGMLISNYRVYIGTDNGAFDNTVSSLDDTGVYIPDTNGTISQFALVESAPWAFIPKKNGSGNVADNITPANGLMCLVAGGKPTTDATLGLFAFDVNQTPTESFSNIGTRLIYIPEETVNAYGVEWDYSQSSTKLTRLDAATSFADPVPAISLTDAGTSPFDNIMPWSGMKRETIGTDEMVYIPEFYFRAEDDKSNSKMRWWISAEPKDGFTLHPGSGRYISRYHVDSAYASVSGTAPIGGQTRATARSKIHAKGDKWWLMDIATWSAIQILYLVEYADWNCQATLGGGQTSGSIVASGATDSAVYHTLNRSKASNQYRWIENPYSNIRDWVDGNVNINYQAYVSTDNTSFNDAGNGFIDTGITVPSTAASGQFISRLGLSESAPWMFIPTECKGSSGTYVSDHVMVTTGTSMRVVGGAQTEGGQWGLFKYDSNDNASFVAANVGARLIYIP